MFKDNKLRLLMTLVGFIRHGEHHDPDATWTVPPTLTSSQLQESIELIQKFEFAPPTYEDGKGPEDFLRSKAAAARRSVRRAEFDDDSDGIDRDSEEDRGEYVLDGPAARESNGARKKLSRRKRAGTPVEIDDEEKDRRAEARRLKELEKQAKVKSTMYIHDSDDEDWDADKDAAFFAREEALREETTTAFKKSLVLDDPKPNNSKKRRAEETVKTSKRRKSPPKKKPMPFDDSDDNESDEPALSESNRASSEEAGSVLADGSPAEATPLSSQHATITGTRGKDSLQKSTDTAMIDANDDDDEDIPIVRRPVARNMRAGFIIDSDSE